MGAGMRAARLMPTQERTYSSQESVRVILKDHVPRPRDLDLTRLWLGGEHLLGRFGAQDV